MSTPYLGEIRAVGFNFAPSPGWALCNGQLLSISSNLALFALLGTTYGGNGITTFGLPNLQARIPLHVSNAHPQGEMAGEAQHTLISSEMPAHTHGAFARSQNGDNPSPAGRSWGLRPTDKAYAPGTSTLVAMSPAAIGSTGGSLPHANMPPYLVLTFLIAVNGIFPSRP